MILCSHRSLLSSALRSQKSVSDLEPASSGTNQLLKTLICKSASLQIVVCLGSDQAEIMDVIWIWLLDGNRCLDFCSKIKNDVDSEPVSEDNASCKQSLVNATWVAQFLEVNRWWITFSLACCESWRFLLTSTKRPCLGLFVCFWFWSCSDFTKEDLTSEKNLNVC